MFAEFQAMFLEIVEGVTTDEDFKIPSPAAIHAVSTAAKLLQWANDESNRASLVEFVTTLSDSIHSCLPRSTGSWKVRREKMWGSFHRLQNSSEFRAAWSDFLLKSIGANADPTFFQHVTVMVLREMIKKVLPIRDNVPDAQPAQITYEEANALWYAAGYVCSSLRKKTESSTHPLK